jgi:hypothetical protein
MNAAEVSPTAYRFRREVMLPGDVISVQFHKCTSRYLTDPVGTLITERPPDRSVRARLRIRLL